MGRKLSRETSCKISVLPFGLPCVHAARQARTPPESLAPSLGRLEVVVRLQVLRSIYLLHSAIRLRVLDARS